MSNRPNLFNTDSESESKSRYKTSQELVKLVRGAKRESYPGIPYLTHAIVVEDDQGPCTIEPDGMDYLELSLLIVNKQVFLTGHSRAQLADLRIFIPEKLSLN